MSNYGTIITGINPDGTFTLSCTKGYFKVEYVSAGSGIYVFCNAGYSVAATWQLEEVLVDDGEEFTVGDGSGGTHYYFPTAFYYNYSLTQQIYTASELGFGAGKISGISFYGTLSYARTRTIDVYIRNIDETKFNRCRTSVQNVAIIDI